MNIYRLCLEEDFETSDPDQKTPYLRLRQRLKRLVPLGIDNGNVKPIGKS